MCSSGDELDELGAVAGELEQLGTERIGDECREALLGESVPEQRREELALELPYASFWQHGTARIASACQRTACASASSVAVSQACRLTTRSTPSSASKLAMSPRSKRSPAAPERSANEAHAAITSSFRSRPTISTERPRSSVSR